MAVGLLDTTILVDILRGFPPTAVWMQTQVGLGITPPVWMELIGGAQNKSGQSHALRLLTKFEMVFLAQTDMQWAMQRLLAYKLSHSVGILDCLIAAPSYRLQLPLYTTNLKHFAPILGSLAQKPY